MENIWQEKCVPFQTKELKRGHRSLFIIIAHTVVPLMDALPFIFVIIIIVRMCCYIMKMTHVEV